MSIIHPNVKQRWHPTITARWSSHSKDIQVGKQVLYIQHMRGSDRMALMIWEPASQLVRYELRMACVRTHLCIVTMYSRPRKARQSSRSIDPFIQW
eukprot:scaffold301870_cov17-Prasinocladus_malaysianus.AAC.2